MDIKAAMKDEVFRNKLPESLNPEVQKFVNNPNCSCNVGVYKKIIKEARDHVQAYFPDKAIMTAEEEAEQLAKNNWRVINCSIGELEAEMKKLPAGRKQVAMSRFEDQVTVIVNELDHIF